MARDMKNIDRKNISHNITSLEFHENRVAGTTVNRDKSKKASDTRDRNIVRDGL